MFKFLIHFISRSLEFSKSEAKGTLGLIFIILISLSAYKSYVFFLKEEEHAINPTEKVALEKWVREVRASIRHKKTEKEHAATPTSDYLGSKSDGGKKGNEGSLLLDEPEKKEAFEEGFQYEDLNTTTKEALQKVRGIGPTFSGRIIKYRNLLGGFASLDQLKEVYGLQEETINELIQHYEISSPPAPLNINSDSAKLLAKHPYISYDLAWIILNYRKQNGDIHSAEDLKKIKSIDEETLNKLRPYLE